MLAPGIGLGIDAWLIPDSLSEPQGAVFRCFLSRHRSAPFTIESHAGFNSTLPTPPFGLDP
jgi:hypothetical protein